jgi:L-aspartate oxidase
VQATGLKLAISTLNSTAMSAIPGSTRRHHQLRNIHTVATLIARCALAREESRGGHFRTDYPEARPAFQKHSVLRKDNAEVSFA